MRILMISDVYFPRVNGVSTSIRTFRSELQALGHRVALIAPRYPQGRHADDPDIVRVPSRGVPRDPEDRMMRRAELKSLLGKLREFQFDALHIHTPFVAHYAGLWLARRLDLPVVETYHTFFEEYLHHYVPLIPKSAMRLLARRLTVSQCNRVDRVVAPSRAMQTALTRYGVRAPIDVLPTGLEKRQLAFGDGPRFRERYGIAQDRPVALYVGRVAYEKNIDFLLRAFREALVVKADALLLIVGEGPAVRSLQALTETLGIASSVRFLGYLERDVELLDCYRAGDVFVFASRTETQGLVLLEALAQGTPVVSTMRMGTRDVLEGARGACVVEEDPEQFSRAVVSVLQDKRKRQSLSILGPRDAVKWSANEMARRLAHLYDAVIRASRARVAAARPEKQLTYR